MKREQLLELIQKLPPNSDVIGMGPDSGGYDCEIDQNVQVIKLTDNVFMVGHFGDNIVKQDWTDTYKERFIINKEEYHKIRKMIESGNCKLNEIAKSLNIPDTMFQDKLLDPIADTFRDLIK